MLATAVQRFILVALPFRAKWILTERYYKTVCFSIAALSVTLTAAAVARTLFENQLNSEIVECSGISFYGNRTVRGVTDGIVFILLPALACVGLYTYVAVALWKQKSNVKRNRQLSILFMASCLVWIVLCLPLKMIDFFKGV